MVSGLAGAAVPKELGAVSYDIAFVETEVGDLHSALPLVLSRMQVLVLKFIFKPARKKLQISLMY